MINLRFSIALSWMTLVNLVTNPLCPAADSPAGIPKGYKLLYEQNFEQPGALKDFVVSDPKAWRLTGTDNQSSMEVLSGDHTRQAAESKPGASKANYRPPFRSPFNIALVADKIFGDFIMDLEMQSTVKPYGHQDLCLFYGFQSTDQFYYTHIAMAADPHAHNIFVVNHADRTKIARETTSGITWGQGIWHRVRLERKASNGTIKIFFDDMTKPIMQAEDKTFVNGHVGFGSFDDMGQYDNIRIWGPSVENRKTGFFKTPEVNEKP
jgi:hypothetical protein